jgi:two-component system sensor histidine kinase PilS (NtrC family)
MNQPAPAQAWFETVLPDSGFDAATKPQEFQRLWRGFMTARMALGLGLLLFQCVIYALGAVKDSRLVLICAVYFLVSLSVRLMASPRPAGKVFDVQWIAIGGVDILAFSLLQVAQGGGINYAPLFVLPILMAAVLGSLSLALGGAAGVTLLLFAHSAWLSLQVPTDASAHFLQAALTGAGCFAIAFLANQIAIRLADVELLAQRSQRAERVQRQVNELVIESLADGILVLDPRGLVRAANPAARHLLGAQSVLGARPFSLTVLAGWQELVDLMELGYSDKRARQADVTIRHVGQGPRRVRVRTQLAEASGDDGETLCVMFMQDLREMEARMRADKLASMGRMSAAVAHEIRNPLAAIAQANALLDEDLLEPRHKQLTQMVQQNARRLERIVDEVLDISRVQQGENAITLSALELSSETARICHDWQQQTTNGQGLRLDLSAQRIQVRFESEHLRRILVNLLDNALRYSGGQTGDIEVSVGCLNSGQGVLRVWNNGQPMDQSVERHLFEPFFSSESRSTGLGLYICRELCEEQGASITYLRTPRQVNGRLIEGNEFLVTFQSHQ